MIGILALGLLFLQNVSANLNPCALCGTPGKQPLPQNYQLKLESGFTCQEIYVALFSLQATDEYW